jgi:ABC-type Fe3+/spermidine/putrescine transport system ATPase subunit
VLRVDNLTKTYIIGDPSIAGGIHGISFAVGAGEFYTLLGPSGCGKTTTLRSVAGLEEPTEGRVALDGRSVFDSASGAFVPANQRNIGMVFQSYAVWPHMTVFDNVAFPLRMSRTCRYNAREVATRVTRTLETMGLGSFTDRSAAQLSGGQQQRLSLARALVAEPRLLLLDEPLSNLDAQLREQMRSELRRLQKEVGVAAVYVTHDQSEALALSDRIAVMCNGRIVQIGTPKQIYYAPTNKFVATFIGRSNLLRGEVLQNVAPGQRAIVQTPMGAVECHFPAGAKAAQPVAALIRPEHIILTSSDPAAGELAPNQFRGHVTNVVFLGETMEYLVQVGDRVQIIVRHPASEGISADAVIVTFPAHQTLGLPGAKEPVS